jgi:hypothetical protein
MSGQQEHHADERRLTDPRHPEDGIGSGHQPRRCHQQRSAGREHRDKRRSVGDGMNPSGDAISSTRGTGNHERSGIGRARLALAEQRGERDIAMAVESAARVDDVRRRDAEGRDDQRCCREHGESPHDIGCASAERGQRVRRGEQQQRRKQRPRPTASRHRHTQQLEPSTAGPCDRHRGAEQHHDEDI